MTTRTKIMALGAALTLAICATAVASTRDDGIPAGALNGVKHAVKKNGALKPRAVGHLQLKNQIIDCQKLTVPLQRRVCGPQQVGLDGPKGETGAKGELGGQGNVGKGGAPGIQGPQGEHGDGQIIVDPANPCLAYTNPSVHLDADGVQFGPYATNVYHPEEPGLSGGSVLICVPAGTHLADIAQLAYTARFTATTDNGDAPYLRVFLNGENDDVVFSPSTQPGACYGPGGGPASEQCASRGRMIHYVVHEGTVRYDDDPGSTPDVSWASVINAHGGDTVDYLVVSVGNSQPDTTGGTLNSLEFEVAGSTPTTLAFAA